MKILSPWHRKMWRKLSDLRFANIVSTQNEDVLSVRETVAGGEKEEVLNCFQNHPSILFWNFANAIEPGSSSARISTWVWGPCSWEFQLRWGSGNLSLKEAFLTPWLPIQCWEPEVPHLQLDFYCPYQLLYPFSHNLQGLHYLTDKLRWMKTSGHVKS